MDVRWRIELLGGLRATQGDREITRFRSRKTGALLAYLAYHLARAHPRDVLVELLWPEADIDRARQSLSMALSSLRHQLEPPGVPKGAVLITDRATVRLNPAAVTTDVAEFETALRAAGSAASTLERLQHLFQAVELYRGYLLPGYYEEWLVPEQQALAELRFQAVRQVIDHLEQAGDLNQAIQYACRAVSADPLREEAHHELIRLYAATGQLDAARRQYRELERLLDEPSADMQRLVQEIKERGIREPELPDTSTVDQAPGNAASPPVCPAMSAPERVVAFAPPAGTITFLLTDVERSTAQWEQVGAPFAAALEVHHSLLRRLFQQCGGYEVKALGEGFLVAFTRAGDALECAVAAQQALAACSWPETVGPLRVRMALHTGDVEPQDNDYRTLVLHYAQRMLMAGHGGQILCSEATAGLLRRQLPPDVRLLDLGVYRLRDVTTSERLVQVNYPAMAQEEFPRLRAETSYSGHLPLQFTRFFGREAEIAQLLELLLPVPATPTRHGVSPRQPRLVILMGPGGSGKTRLALEAAGRKVEPFRGAVWFVPLAEVAEPRLVVSAIQDALRLPRSPGTEPLEQLVAALSPQPALLVLDNFEHLLPEGAWIVRTLLERAPTLTCLITSRRKLKLAGEQEFPVPPLPTPKHASTPEELTRCDSVQLFVDRAQAVRPDFQVTPANAAAVATLCQRLEGIPLALELAAARVASLTPAQVLQQLQRPLDFLASKQQGIPARHLTVRAAVAWSYQLLSPELQRLFARLSMFHGGWTLEAAEAVAVADDPGLVAPALDYLEELRECSLVDVVEAGETARYRLLETLQAYASERLKEQPDVARAVANRHARYYMEFGETRVARKWTRDEEQALQELQQELDNLRAAMDRAQASDQGEFCARLAPVLYPALYGRGFWEEARWRLQAGRAAAERLEGDTRGLLAAISYDIACLAEEMADLGEARRQAEVALTLRRELKDTSGAAEALNLLGLLVRKEGDMDAAQRHFNEALDLLADSDPVRRGMLLTNLAGLALRRGEMDKARGLYQESLSGLRAAGDLRHEATALNNLGLLAHQYDHDYAGARHLYHESLALYRRLRDQHGIAITVNNLGEIAEQEGDIQTAITLLVHAERMLRDLPSSHVTVPTASLQRLAERLGAEQYAERRSAAEQMEWDQLVDQQWGAEPLR
jgi:predicted ATPase/DNA-binding SARP family transcriptional activator